MEQRQVLDDSFFILLYGGVVMAALIACCYLLFRRGNAFASEVTSPPRLRRWAAAFLATIYMPGMSLQAIKFASSGEATVARNGNIYTVNMTGLTFNE